MATEKVENRDPIAELFYRTNNHGEQLAVMAQEQKTMKGSLSRVENAMGQHGELLHAIKADFQANRFPGLAQIVQMTALVGTIAAMVVAAISYISANFVGASLGPKITGIEKQNILLEYRLSQVENRPDIRSLMFRSRLK